MDSRFLSLNLLRMQAAAIIKEDTTDGRILPNNVNEICYVGIAVCREHNYVVRVGSRCFIGRFLNLNFAEQDPFRKYAGKTSILLHQGLYPGV